MTKYTLIAEYPDGGKVTREFNQEYLPDVIQEFDYFLRGVGFYYTGVIDIVEEETYTTTDKTNSIIEEWSRSNNEQSDYYFDTERNK